MLVSKNSPARVLRLRRIRSGRGCDRPVSLGALLQEDGVPVHLGPPASCPSHQPFLGRIPVLKQTTDKKRGTLILTSLLEDLVFFV